MDDLLPDCRASRCCEPYWSATSTFGTPTEAPTGQLGDDRLAFGSRQSGNASRRPPTGMGLQSTGVRNPLSSSAGADLSSTSMWLVELRTPFEDQEAPRFDPG